MPEEGTKNYDIAKTLYALVEKIREYVDTMIGGVDRPQNERVALSKNAVRSLGFTKTLRKGELLVREVVGEDRAGRERQRRQGYAPIIFGGPDDDDDDGDGGDSGFDDGNRSYRGMFNAPRGPREDGEHQAPRGDRDGFDDDVRNTFGARSGSFFDTGGRAYGSYFGEEDGGDDAAAEETTAAAGAEGLRDMLQGAPARDRIQHAREGSAALSSQYDPDTQEFNAVRPRGYNQFVGRPQAAEAAVEAPPAAGVRPPTSRADLPSDLAGYKRYSEQLRAAGFDKVPVNREGTGIGKVRAYWIRRYAL
jgi:hypothetical protein